MNDLIRRKDVLDLAKDIHFSSNDGTVDYSFRGIDPLAVIEIPSVEPDEDKFEYHYDHTDCIWYHDGKGRCPSACSQYRDGWNDAMLYIFKGGLGYRPFRRGEKYE